MIRKLRVAIVGPYPRDEGKSKGGVESVTEALADGLARVDGVEVHALTCVKGLKSVVTRITSAGTYVHLIPLFDTLGCLTKFFIDAPRIRRELRRIGPDIVHVQSQMLYAHAALEREWPSVLTIHGIRFREAKMERGYKGLQHRYAIRYELDAVRRARNVICLNKYSRDAYGDLLSKARIRFIDNPIDDVFFGIENREEPGRILLLAAMRRLKGIEYLIQGAAILRDEGVPVDVHCFGPTPDEDYCCEMNALIARLRLSDLVHLRPRASKDEVVKEYAKASVVVLPSLLENAPMVISEAMAAGKPVVATPAGGIPDMVDDGKTGFIVPMRDAVALAKAIGTLIRDSDLRVRLGAASKEVAEKRFRRSAVVDKTLEFYREILGERK
jgi:glycosyltransferase involved in cell wall biosynthesis